MNCPQCGMQAQDGARFCPQCGAPLSREMAQQPVQPGASQQPGAAPGADRFAQPQAPCAQPAQPQPQPAYAQPGNPAGIEDKSTMFIVLSVLEFLFCGGLVAIWPFVMSLNYKSAVERGDAAAAQAKHKSARTALIVTLVIGIVLTVICILVIVALCAIAGSGYSSGSVPYGYSYSYRY